MSKAIETSKSNDKETDLVLINKNNNYYKPSLKREIIYDIARNKYYLYDTENNKLYPSNLFGKNKARINSSKIGRFSSNENIKNDIIGKLDDNAYHPKIKYFDGFSQIPRPLVQPFTNFYNDNNNKEKKIIQSKSDILNIIKKRKIIISKDNKYNEILSRNSDNEMNIPGLNYFSSSVADSVNNRKNNIHKNKVIKSINSSLNDKNMNIKEKNRLKKFKSDILNNSENIFNGKELKEPNKIIKRKYRINHNVFFVNPIKKSKINHDTQINLDIYRALYKSINNNKITRLRNSNSELNNLIQKSKKIFRPNSVITLQKKYKILQPEKYNFTKRETKRYDTEEEYKENIKIKKNINSLKDINEEYKKEKQDINGYIKPIKKEPPILRKGYPKYKSGKEIYKKELNLLKLVNPQKLKQEEDENYRRDNYLKKKIEKNRKIKIIKDKNVILGKRSRLNSAFSNITKDINEYIE